MKEGLEFVEKEMETGGFNEERSLELPKRPSLPTATSGPPFFPASQTSPPSSEEDTAAEKSTAEDALKVKKCSPCHQECPVAVALGLGFFCSSLGFAC